MTAMQTNSTPAVVFTALTGVAIVAVIFYGASRKRKHALSPQQWKVLFTEDGRLRDGGIRLLKRVRSGGVGPRIRAEVWPFLLGVYNFNNTKDERDAVRTQNRKEYEKLHRTTLLPSPQPTKNIRKKGIRFRRFLQPASNEINSRFEGKVDCSLPRGVSTLLSLIEFHMSPTNYRAFQLQA